MKSCRPQVVQFFGLCPHLAAGYNGWRGLAEIKPAKTNQKFEVPKVITRLLKSLQSVDFLSGQKDVVCPMCKVSTDPVLSLAVARFI